MIETVALTLGIATSRSAPSQFAMSSPDALNAETYAGSVAIAELVYPMVKVVDPGDAALASAVLPLQLSALARALESENLTE